MPRTCKLSYRINGGTLTDIATLEQELEELQVYEDGACVCTVRQREENVCVKEDTNIIMMNGVHFELSEDEMKELNPQTETQWTVD